jgi:hypothetical protein
MSMFGPKMGSWWVSSEKDPRWNKNGRGKGLVCTGGPPEAHKWIEKCRKTLGEQPDDLEYGFMKD